MWRSAMVVMTALMMLPKTALATVYNFSDTETSALSSGPVSFTFALDTTTANPSGNGTLFNNVSIQENGTLFSGNSVQALFGTSLGSPLFFLVDTASEPFYRGSGNGIQFNTGVFAIADGATDGEGTLNISAAPVSPVPEPAAWILLLTGVMMAAAVLGFSRTSERGLGGRSRISAAKAALSC